MSEKKEGGRKERIFITHLFKSTDLCNYIFHISKRLECQNKRSITPNEYFSEFHSSVPLIRIFLFTLLFRPFFFFNFPFFNELLSLYIQNIYYSRHPNVFFHPRLPSLFPLRLFFLTWIFFFFWKKVPLLFHREYYFHLKDVNVDTNWKIN